MQIAQHYDQDQDLRELSQEEQQLGQRIFKTNLNFKAGESVLIVTDTAFLEKEAAIWFETAKALGASKVSLMVLEGMTRSGQEPPVEVVEACKLHDTALLHTTHSLTHTQAGKTIAKSGNRGFSLPGVDYQMMLRTLNIDYSPIHQLGENLKKFLEQNKTLKIKSPHGTDITTNIRTDHVLADTGFAIPGDIGNLPAGEVFFAPLDNTTNGTWVVNGSMADFEETGLDEPIVIKIERGTAVEISGGKSADRLRKILDEVGPDAYHIAEIGIGINPSANPHGHLIEAEKAYATAHLALGNSSSMGGSVNVPIHLDGVTLDVEMTTTDINGKTRLLNAT